MVRARPSIGMMPASSRRMLSSTQMTIASTSSRTAAASRGGSRPTPVAMEMWRCCFMPSEAPMKVSQTRA